jgi:hypothetical protein
VPIQDTLLNKLEADIWASAFGAAIARGAGRGLAIEAAYAAVAQFRMPLTNRDVEVYDRGAIDMFVDLKRRPP